MWSEICAVERGGEKKKETATEGGTRRENLDQRRGLLLFFKVEQEAAHLPIFSFGNFDTDLDKRTEMDRHPAGTAETDR